MLEQEVETTKKQDRVLNYFAQYEKEHGEPPTVRQAAIELGYKAHNPVYDILLVLERKRLMKRVRGIWYVVDGRQNR